MTLNNKEGGTNLITREEKGVAGVLGADLQNIDKSISQNDRNRIIGIIRHIQFIV